MFRETVIVCFHYSGKSLSDGPCTKFNDNQKWILFAVIQNTKIKYYWQVNVLNTILIKFPFIPILNIFSRLDFIIKWGICFDNNNALCYKWRCNLFEIYIHPVET